MAVRSPVSFDLGEDWFIDHTALGSDGVTPVPLTGATGQLQIATQEGVVVVAPSAVTWTITNAAEGESTFWVPPTSQTNVSPGVYQYTIRITLSSGVVTDMNTGTWTVKATAFGA